MPTKRKLVKRKRKAPKRSPSCQQLVQVSKWGEISVIVLYARSGDAWIGAYYGYSGGGTFDDGMFELDKRFKVVLCSQDKADFPAKYHDTIQSLQEKVWKYEDWSEETALGKASRLALRRVRG